MNLAERLIIKSRNYWLRRGFLLSNPAQAVLIKKWMEMFQSEQFKKDTEKLSRYIFARRLIKSARFSVGKMISQTS